MDNEKEFKTQEDVIDEVSEEKLKEEAYNKAAEENVHTDNPGNQSGTLYSKYGKYKGKLNVNNKDAYTFSKPVSICVIIGTIVGIIISLITGAVAYALICIFASFLVGLIVGAILKKKHTE